MVANEVNITHILISRRRNVLLQKYEILGEIQVRDHEIKKMEKIIEAYGMANNIILIC